MTEWIEWKGGSCPVPADSRVDVRFRTGEDDHGAEARQWSWSLSHDGDDIIAYRLHHSEQKEAKLNGWIKCSEGTPTSGKPLLVCTPDGVVQRTVYDFDPSDNTWQDWYEQHDPVPLECFGFWQPLPPPPEE